MMQKPIIIPLINPNEPDAYLASLLVKNGQKVVAGELLCVLETTKSTVELTAEVDGYVVGIQYQEGDTVSAGDYLGFISSEKDWKPSQVQGDQTNAEDVPEGLRITKPALELAKAHGLDLNTFRKDMLITERVVRDMVEKGKQEQLDVVGEHLGLEHLIIYGGGGHGKSVLDLIRTLNVYQVIGFIDDNMPAGEKIMGVPVLGGQQVLADLYKKGVRLAVNAVGGIGNIAVRLKVSQILRREGFSSPTIVHPTAFVEQSALLESGVQVFPHAYIGSEVKIGFGSIVNTGAIVSHDCVLGSFVNLSPGAILAGGVQVGDQTLIGMGVTVNLSVSIGRNVRIGNSATVKTDVPDGGIVRAGATWPND